MNNPSEPKPAKAYAYIRLSSQAQALGDGERRQLESATEFAARHGLTIDETLHDIGVSAFRSKNSRDGALGGFLELAQKGEIGKGSMIVVESFDRLTRDEPVQALQLLLDLIKAEIRIGITATNTVMDGLTYMVLLPFMSEMSRANSESVHKSIRSMGNWDTKRLKAAKGVPVSSRCPHWMEVRDGAFLLIPERVEIVKLIYDLYSQGLGQGAIAKRLAQDGVLAWNKRQAVWHTSYIFKTLHNRAVIGEYQPDITTEEGRRYTETIANYYPPIIDSELFERIQNQTFLRRKNYAGRKGKKYANLFQGLARCSVCGGTMRYLDHTKEKLRQKPWAQYLVCSSGYEKHGCANNQYYNYRVLENFILAGTLAEVDIIEAAGLHREAVREHAAMIEDLEAQLMKADAAIGRMVDALADDGLLDLQELKQSLAEHQKKRQGLREELSKLRAEAMEARQAAESSELFRNAGTAPDDINMSDEAVYERRMHIARQMRSIIESVKCEENHRVIITTKSGTRYELEDKDWTRVEQHRDPVRDRVFTARIFAGRAVTRLP